MACLPDDTVAYGGTTWIGYGYYNWYLTAFRGPWCSYPSIQMHEIGHNLDFAHSGEGSDEYDDKTCMVSTYMSGTISTFFKSCTEQQISPR